MEGVIILAAAVPIGLFIGWLLGISAWRQVGPLRAEVAALRRAMEAAGIRPAPAAEAPRPNPWATPAPAVPSQDPPDPPAPPAADPIEQPAAAGKPRRPGLEEALTLRWGTWLGAGALLLAAVFLVRTAVEEGWLGPAARCALGGALGVILVGLAEWLRRRARTATPGTTAWPDLTPAALAAGGVAMLFGAAYAAAVLYALVPPLAGFVLMAAAAVAGLALALLHGPLVAAVGILGAYGTPALVGSDDPSLPGLFLYLLVVTAAALAVVRQVGAAWLGWATTIAAAGWVLVGGVMAAGPGDLWAPSLFIPAAAALHLGLLPGAALDGAIGRRLAWVPFGILAATGLALLLGGTASLGPATGLLLLTPVAVLKGATERRLDRLPWLAALAGLLLLLAWPIGAWVAGGEAVTVEGAILAILPNAPWPPEALRPFLIAALLLAAMHAAAGAWLERRAANPLPWAALPAAVPVLVLLVAYARARGFETDVTWGLVALALAAALLGAATLAKREAATQRAGVHAAGAVAAMALGAAMVLSDQWLTLAVALFLPALAWIEARADLPPLRRVALVVAGVVLARLLLNWHVLDYDFGSFPVLNGLLPAYGVPAIAFGLAAFMYRRRADDLAVAVLEAGAIAFATALVLLQIRHAVTGGALAAEAIGWTFRQGAMQVFALSLLAMLLRLADRRLHRPVLRWGWRVLQALALVVGGVLLVVNPAVEAGATLLATPILNELALAFALPALLAGLAAAAPESGRPGWLRPVLAGYALLAAFAWVTLEVRHLFQPEAMALVLAEPGGAELYAYSGAWLLLAAGLLALGIRLRVPALRIAALAVMALTVGKAFLVDMGGLVGLWRVLSFLGLGLALIALGWVYRRFGVVAGR